MSYRKKTQIEDADNGQTASITNNNLNVNIKGVFSIPDTFTKMTMTSANSYVTKGDVTKVVFLPAVLNEQSEDNSVVVDTVTSTNMVGQIFKASEGTISALVLTLENSKSSFKDVLTSVNVSDYVSNTGNYTPTFDTNYSGMKLDLGYENEEWTKTLTATNMKNTSLNISLLVTEKYNKAHLDCFVEDSLGNKAYVVIRQTYTDILETFRINTDSFLVDNSSIDLKNITKIGFKVGKEYHDVNKEFAYISSVELIDKPRHLGIELYDFGTTKPTTSSLSSATQYSSLGLTGNKSLINLSLDTGKRFYVIEDLMVGISSQNYLTPGNYYGLVLKYIDSEVKVYGSDVAGTKSYINGYSFTCPDTATNINQLGNSDLNFGIFSIKDVWIDKIEFRADSQPGNKASYYIYKESNGKIDDLVSVISNAPEQYKDFDLQDRPIFLAAGDKIELYYSDGVTDIVERVGLDIRYYY